MSEQAAALLAEALKLNEVERIKLADELYESVDEQLPDIDSMSEEEFERELNRRHEEFLRDPSVAIPMDEVKRLTRIGLAAKPL